MSPVSTLRSIAFWLVISINQILICVTMSTWSPPEVVWLIRSQSEPQWSSGAYIYFILVKLYMSNLILQNKWGICHIYIICSCVSVQFVIYLGHNIVKNNIKDMANMFCYLSYQKRTISANTQSIIGYRLYCKYIGGIRRLTCCFSRVTLWFKKRETR